MRDLNARKRTELGLGIMAASALAMSMLAAGVVVTRWLLDAGHLGPEPGFRGHVWIPPGILFAVGTLPWLSAALALGATLVALGARRLGSARWIVAALAIGEVAHHVLAPGHGPLSEGLYPTAAAYALPALLVAVWPRRWRAVVGIHAAALLLLTLAMLVDQHTEAATGLTTLVCAVWGGLASLALFRARGVLRVTWRRPSVF